MNGNFSGSRKTSGLGLTMRNHLRFPYNRIKKIPGKSQGSSAFDLTFILCLILIYVCLINTPLPACGFLNPNFIYLAPPGFLLFIPSIFFRSSPRSLRALSAIWFSLLTTSGKCSFRSYSSPGSVFRLKSCNSY